VHQLDARALRAPPGVLQLGFWTGTDICWSRGHLEMGAVDLPIESPCASSPIQAARSRPSQLRAALQSVWLDSPARHRHLSLEQDVEELSHVVVRRGSPSHSEKSDLDHILCC
jgi:hypothetical protein